MDHKNRIAGKKRPYKAAIQSGHNISRKKKKMLQTKTKSLTNN